MPPRFVDDCHHLDACAIFRAGVLNNGTKTTWEWSLIGSPASRARAKLEAVDGVLEVRYRLENGQPIEQWITIEWIACRPTCGAKPYWHCPTCGRRCSRLYGTIDCIFRCCECHGLRWRSRSENEQVRRLRRLTQVGELLMGNPVGSSVPRSARPSHPQKRKRRLQSRLHDLFAAVALELLRGDD
jgi:hypothetical protein